jgi:hypothetical protein
VLLEASRRARGSEHALLCQMVTATAYDGKFAASLLATFAYRYVLLSPTPFRRPEM